MTFFLPRTRDEEQHVKNTDEEQHVKNTERAMQVDTHTHTHTTPSPSCHLLPLTGPMELLRA